MWLGEQITERGVGNGISLLIFSNIVAGFPAAIGRSFEAARQGDINIIALLAIGVFAIVVVAFVVFIERGQRRITVNYAKRQQGRRVYQAQSSHLPLKVNMAGVIPAIFASSLLLAPSSLAQWFGQTKGMEWLQEVSLVLSPGQPLYILMFAGGIVFFSFFYTAIVFDPKDVAENLQRQGAYVPGIRPGQHTAKYIDDVITRLTDVRRAVRDAGVSAAGIHGRVLQGHVPARRYRALDRRGRRDGLHGAGTGAPDVESVREADGKVESEELWARSPIGAP